MQHDADLVVIGGGLVGMLTALEAQRVGLDVCLVDKNFSESGDHAPSVLFSMGVPKEVQPIFEYSLKQWAELAESAQDPIGLNHNGVGFVALSEPQAQGLQKFADQHQGFKVFTDPGEMAAALRITQVGSLKGLLLEAEGFHVYSSMAHASLRRDLMQGGARIFGSDVVAELIIEKEKVVGVKTKHETIRAKSVALCTGAWTGKFLEKFGLKLPMRPARSHRIELSVTGEMPKMPLVYPLREGNIIVRPMRSGRVLVVYTGLNDEQQETWDHHIDHATVKIVLQGIAQLLPALANAKVQHVEASTLAVTPDMLPYLGRVASMDGLYVAAGMNSQTFLYGPAVAKSVALLVSGKAPEVDMTPFSPDRYILKDMAEKATAAPEPDEVDDNMAELAEQLAGLDADAIERQLAETAAAREAAKEAGNLKTQGKELADTAKGKVKYAGLKKEDNPEEKPEE